MSKYTQKTPYIPKRVFHGSNGNSKIGKILNINLIAGDDGINKRTTETGSCSGCCDSCKDYCYARKSYRYDDAIVAHADNTYYARTDLNGFFRDLNSWIKSKKCKTIRYHSHGEIPNKEYFGKVVDTARSNPDKEFYIYTKRYDIVNNYMDKNFIPSNLSILLSPPFTCDTPYKVLEWELKENKHGLPLFIYDNGNFKTMKHCPAVDKKGHKTGITCDKCRRCVEGKTSAVYAH